MIIFAIYQGKGKLEVKNIKIKNINIEHRFLSGKYIIIEGYCTVNPDDFREEPFVMDFVYEGKSNEPSSKLTEYLQTLGWQRYQEMCHEKEDTLIEFVNRNKI